MQIKGREAAWLTLQATLAPDGIPLDKALNDAFNQSGAVAQDRPFAMELAYGVVRHKGWLDFLLNRHLKTGMDRTPPGIANILRLGAYQVLFIHSVPVFASVSETVNMARRVNPKAPTGLINAVLRRVAEHRDDYQPDRARPDDFPSRTDYILARYSMPLWIVERLIQQWGEQEAAEFCAASLEVAPLTVRLNGGKGSAETFLRLASRLNVSQVEQLDFPPGALNVQFAGPPGASLAIKEGWIAVQDAAAQLVSFYVDPRPGEHIVDLCAAPGGKAIHMAELAGPTATIHAIDISKERLTLIRENIQRLGIGSLETHLKSGALMRIFARDGVDRVLVDAPCSGLGVLRRNPDIKWRRTPEQVDALAAQQLDLLNEAASIVKPGGVMVYSTCTVLPDENQNVIEAFIKEHPDWSLDDLQTDPVSLRLFAGRGPSVKSPFVMPLPHRHAMDGFFIARLRRVKTNPA